MVTLVWFALMVIGANGAGLYDKCDAVGFTFCIGIRSINGINYVSFSPREEKNNCLKHKDCDIVIRGDRDKAANKYDWTVATISKESSLIQVLINDTKYQWPKERTSEMPRDVVYLEGSSRGAEGRKNGSSARTWIHYEHVGGRTDLSNDMNTYIAKSATSQKEATKEYNVYKYESTNQAQHHFKSKQEIGYLVSFESPLYFTVLFLDTKQTPKSWIAFWQSDKLKVWEKEFHDDNRPAPTEKSKTADGKPDLLWLWILLAILGLILLAILLYCLLCRKKAKRRSKSKTKVKKSKDDATDKRSEMTTTTAKTPKASDVTVRSKMSDMASQY